MRDKKEWLRVIDNFLNTCSEDDLTFLEMKHSKAQFRNRFLLFVDQYEKNKENCFCELPREKYERRFQHSEYSLN